MILPLRASEGVGIARVMERRCKVTRYRDSDLYCTSIASKYVWMEYTAFIRNAHIFTTRRISLSCTRTYTTTQVQDQRPIVHIPTGSEIYAFGAPSHTRSPLLRDLGWTVNDGEAWAIISDGGGRGKKTIFNVSLFVS